MPRQGHLGHTCALPSHKRVTAQQPAAHLPSDFIHCIAVTSGKAACCCPSFGIRQGNSRPSRVGMEEIYRPNKPCGKAPLSPAHKPVAKRWINLPVHNWRFYTQADHCCLTPATQDFRAFIHSAMPRIQRPAAIYPQKFTRPFINIKTSLLKKSFFFILFIPRLARHAGALGTGARSTVRIAAER